MTPIDENKVILKYQAILGKEAFENQMEAIIHTLSSSAQFKVTLVLEKT